MPIRSFIQPGAFDPEAIAAMSEALAAALKEPEGIGEPDVVRERIDHWIKMRRSLVQFSGPGASNRCPS